LFFLRHGVYFAYVCAKPLGVLTFCGGRYPRLNHFFQIWLRSVRGFSVDWVLPYLIDFDSQLYNILTQSHRRLSVWWPAKSVGNGDFDPCRSETIENFITKIGHIDYVAGCNTHAKCYGNRPRGIFPTNSWNINAVWLCVPSLSFPFPCRRLQQ